MLQKKNRWTFWPAQCLSFSVWLIFTQHNALQLHPCCCKWQDFLLCKVCTIFCHIYTARSLPTHLLVGTAAVSAACLLGNATVNTGVQMSPRGDGFVAFRKIPRSAIAESHGSSIFNFSRNVDTVFHNGCTNWCAHPQRTGFLFTPSLPSRGVWFLMTAIPTHLE